jgi:hypothetical protein
MWAFPAALVIASLGPFALTAALWILADAPARRLTRWWALPALLLSYVFVPIYAIRRNSLSRYTAALIFGIALGAGIWMTGRVDWGVGKQTYLSTFLSDRGVPDERAQYLDPSNPTPLVLLIWFLVVAILSISAARTEPERGPEPSRGGLLLGAVCAVGSAAGWILRPQRYEESGRMVATTLAMLLSIFAFVMLQRAARAHLSKPHVGSRTGGLGRVYAAASSDRSESQRIRLRAAAIDELRFQRQFVPICCRSRRMQAASAGGVLIFVHAARQKRTRWMGAGLCMAVSGIASSLGTLQILTGRGSWPGIDRRPGFAVWRAWRHSSSSCQRSKAIGI